MGRGERKSNPLKRQKLLAFVCVNSQGTVLCPGGLETTGKSSRGFEVLISAAAIHYPPKNAGVNKEASTAEFKSALCTPGLGTQN